MTNKQKIIKAAILSQGNSYDAITGECLEYSWMGADEVEDTREWDGDVMGYLGQYDVKFIDPCKYAIHNMPKDAIVVANAYGAPGSIWWVEEVDSALLIDAEAEYGD